MEKSIRNGKHPQQKKKRKSGNLYNRNTEETPKTNKETFFFPLYPSLHSIGLVKRYSFTRMGFCNKRTAISPCPIFPDNQFPIKRKGSDYQLPRPEFLKESLFNGQSNLNPNETRLDSCKAYHLPPIFLKQEVRPSRDNDNQR